jgi:hypothetical protein
MSKPPVTADLRRIALTAPPAQFDISPPSTTYGVWAVLMDTTFGEGSYTAVALADGNASLYTGGQSGVIGGFAHAEVRRSAIAAVATAERLASSCSPSSPQRLPRPGHVRFHLRTREVLLVSSELSEEGLGAGEHPLSELFYAVHEVIRQLRMVSERLSAGG